MFAGETSPNLEDQPSSSETQNFDYAEPGTKIHIVQRRPTQLKPHPRNEDIYGNEDVSDLVEYIRLSGWVKPLVCTLNNTIISGHRRWKAALELGIESIPVESREFSDETAELEALLLENASRFKTTEQKVREGIAWSDIEKEKARERQRFAAYATNQKLSADSQDALCENFHTASKGRAAGAIASRVGFGSGRTYEKASAVVLEMDSLKEDTPEAALALRKTLNEQSVNAAHMLMKKSPEERQAIARLILSGEAKSTKHAQQMIKKDSSAESNNPPQETCGGYSLAEPQVSVEPRDEADGATQSNEELSEEISDKPAEVVEDVGSFSSSGHLNPSACGIPLPSNVECNHPDSTDSNDHSFAASPRPKADSEISEICNVLISIFSTVQHLTSEQKDNVFERLVYHVGAETLGELVVKSMHQYEIVALCHNCFAAMSEETFSMLEIGRIKLSGLRDSDLEFLDGEVTRLLSERHITTL